MTELSICIFTFELSTKPSTDCQHNFFAASPLTCLKDHPRKGEKLTLSPSGTLAAITDSLGRILLLDTQALVVVRLWKVFSHHAHPQIFFMRQPVISPNNGLYFFQGYRDASCLFTEMLVSKDTAASSSSYYEPVKSDYCLCLAIHAPRKGIVEVSYICKNPGWNYAALLVWSKPCPEPGNLKISVGFGSHIRKAGTASIILALLGIPGLSTEYGIGHVHAGMADEDWTTPSNCSMLQRQ